jgi:sec-independent protein translocase protein TatB
MFDLFSWSHILILLTVALIVVGPKDLPRMMNMAGKWVGKARNMANEFKKSFDDMARQSELDALRAEIEKLKSEDPVADATRDLNHEIQRTLNPVDTGNPVGTADPAETGAQLSEEAQAAPPPRSGEYQVSDSETPPPKPEAAAP